MHYLSEEWLVQADERVRSLPPLEHSLRVGFLITGGPDGDRSYTLVLGPSQVAITPDIEQTNATFTANWPDAIAIAQGQLSAQRAFLDGAVTLSGDTASLIGHDLALHSATDCLASLRDVTDYG